MAAPAAARPPEILPPRGSALPGKPSDPGVMKGPKVAAPPAADPAPAAAPPDAPPPPVAAPAPEAVAGPPDAPGEDRAWADQMTAGIRQVVDDHRDAIVDCYRRAAKGSTPEDPLRGRLEVHLRILPAGDADDVRVVQNQTGSTELGDCLVTHMQAWRYPAPGPAAMEFVWPFTFRGQR